MKAVLVVFATMVFALSLNAKTITLVINVPDDTETITEKIDEFPIIFNARVEKWLEHYAATGREYLAKKLWESGKYCAMMKKIFKENGLPPDLIYLAFVESGFNPYAYSRAHAVGVWQFMKTTGKLRGLESNNWIDERRDVEKSTYAAAGELKSLFNEFGSWPLAIAAYNCGSNGLWQAIKNQGTKDFWLLILPLETIAFVPKVIAAIMICRDPESYGFSNEISSPEQPDAVNVTGCIDLKVVAKCCCATIEEIGILNPELTQLCTPGDSNGYILRIPAGTRNMFLQNFEALPDNEKYLSGEEVAKRKGGWVFYTIKKGNNLGSIAKKFRTTVANIKKWNPYTSHRKYIQPGDKVRVFKRD